MIRRLSMHYILESTFARIFLFLEIILQLETRIMSIYINLHNLPSVPGPGTDCPYIYLFIGID